jgi:hypothetical protein
MNKVFAFLSIYVFIVLPFSSIVIDPFIRSLRPDVSVQDVIAINAAIFAIYSVIYLVSQKIRHQASHRDPH